MNQAAEWTSSEIRRYIPSDGVYYRGRPPWMTDDILQELREEAAERRSQALRFRRQFHVQAGPRGLAIVNSAPLLELIAEYAAPALASGSANYLYYEREGDGIDPHIDTSMFDLNLLMLLEHSWISRPRSCLTLFPNGPDRPLKFWLVAGEFVLFRATSVVHTRTNVAAAETVCNLGIGYQPANPLPGISHWRPQQRVDRQS